MNGTQPLSTPPGASPGDVELSRRVDTGAWATFFIWVGITMLAHIRWSWFLVGVGVLILGAQVARFLVGLGVDGFGVAFGVIFLAGGVWELAVLPWSLAPVMLILLGGYLLRKAIW